MKKLMGSVSVFAVTVLATLLPSCVSIQDREMNANEMGSANIAGSVSADFTSFQFLHIPAGGSLKRKARTELMRVARQQYQGNIEIRNIAIHGGFSGWEIFFSIGIPALGVGGIAAAYGEDIDFGLEYGWPGVLVNVLGNFQKITATGDVVLLGSSATGNIDMQGLSKALDTSAATLITSMPSNASIAILNVSSREQAVASYVIDELEFRLVASRRFRIVDRHRLEQIRREQDFQLSGEVSDASAVSIGNLLGATIVITGDISSDTLGNRLVLRALNVMTGQIITMVLERF